MFQTLFWIAIILNPNSIQSICCFDSIPKGKNTCCVFKLAFLLAHQANTKNKKKPTRRMQESGDPTHLPSWLHYKYR